MQRGYQCSQDYINGEKFSAKLLFFFFELFSTIAEQNLKTVVINLLGDKHFLLGFEEIFLTFYNAPIGIKTVSQIYTR